MGDTQSDPGPRRKRRVQALESSSSSGEESDFEGAPSRRRTSRQRVFEDSDCDSDSSIDVNPRKTKRRPVLISESEDSSSSGSEIGRRRQMPSAILSDEDSYASDWSTNSTKAGNSSKTQPAGNDGSSSDSDGQSDKCPICLLTFKTQEVGSPEACDHSFCIECIQEWSKNVNTCPVDRQPFNLILVRSHFNGKIIRQVPIEPKNPSALDEIVVEDDPTYCEICGRCDREDRMLLCDGCDLGYHLECLTPPLSDVPAGVWYCSDCGTDEINQDYTIYLREVELLMNDAQDVTRPSGPRRRNTIRLVPRTRQSERVRARIMTNRGQRNQTEDQIEVVVGTSSSTRRRRKKSRRSRKPKIKITYALDQETGQKIVIQTKSRRSRRRKNRRARLAARRAAEPKTVKKRLAVQLGMCAPRTSGQILPDVRVSMESNRIGFQRSQAGIPTLNIFGARDDLDFFSGSDADNEGEGVSLLRARRPNMSDAAVFRRSANRKNILLSSAPTTSSDLLGSILDSQEKFHSKNAVLSVRQDGSIAVDTKRKPPPMNNNNERVNLNNDTNIKVKRAPTSNTAEPSPGSPTMSTNSTEYRNAVNTVTSNTITTSNNSVSTSSGGSGDCPMEPTQNCSINTSCSNDAEQIKKPETPKSDSELDIYSDIETVSTSKADESKAPSPIPEAPLMNIQSDDEANNSDVDLVIDTEKVEEKPIQEEEHESKEEDVTSTTNVGPPSEEPPEEKSCDEDADSEDGCPNFSIYSAESIKLAKTTDLELLNQEANVGSSLDVAEPPKPDEEKVAEEEQEEEEEEEKHPEEPEPEAESPEPHPPPPESPEKPPEKVSDPTALYSDSDDEVAKVDAEKPFGIGDIRSMTEDISEEERSYTPCLDERQPFREGLEGLDTEAISDEEKNDFDEAQELKTASDGGDALEINAKECELDFTKPEEYEEGEIVDKLKKLEEAKKAETNNNEEQAETPPVEKEVPSKESPNFKKISKSNKDRNYRDKEKDGSKSPSKERESNKKKEKKKEKRKEIERYNVRTVVAEKPRRMKDKFGRDCRRRSLSRSSRSTSPPYRSVSRGRRSYSREKTRKRRGRSHSASRSRKRSRSRNRRRSLSRTRNKRARRSRDRSKPRKKNRSLSRHRSRSLSPRRRRDWERRSRGWSPSPSRSRSPLTPSWTPPRMLEKQPVKPHNLTVILTNDSNKKKKDKKRAEKKKKESEKQKKRKRDKTPPPSKEVFASGDNILVSVSFNDEREREATVKRKRDDDLTTKRTRKERERLRREQRSPKSRRKKNDLAGVKPVAIIDLDRSPFKELTPSPKDVIVLSDSENGETREDVVCDSSQQPDYPTGPKTPPEPQIKFSLNAKAPQLRAINNPLHEPDDMDGEMDPQEELEARLNDTLHKGPNTPPEPPNSPPSSPDAYDPFDPTKSRSPTPDNTSNVQSCLAQSTENNLNEASDGMEKTSAQLAQTPDVSHTPPVVTDIQPADSQSNASTNTPDITSKQTPERNIGVVINQVVQSQPSIFPSQSKSGAQTTTYSSAPVVTTTPLPTNHSASKINILNATILPPSGVISSIPQRIVLPTTTKSSPIKVAPTKPPIKSTPIKPMPNKNISKASKVPARKTNNRVNDGNDSTVDLDSPYSPGPSDYEDLFEPPSESLSKQKSNKGNKNNKTQGTFDALFGGSPTYKVNKNAKTKKKSGKGTKMVGVKVDEDSLKILDDLPNSAVEMQVKDKFLKKLNRQERVVEEVKLVLKPHYNKKHINKEEYKDILRRSVPKICHNKSGEINPKKIQNLIEAYVKKIRHSKKVTSSSSVNPQK